MILVPDTSSLINLQEVYISSLHVTTVLERAYTILISTEIRREVRRHSSKFGVDEPKFIRFARDNERRFNREKEYDSVILSELMPGGNPERNRGERYSCGLALYEVRRRSTSSCILLCDDRKADRGLLSYFEECSRAAHTWSSLDLLMNIYLIAFPKWPLIQAKGAIRSVNAKMEGTPEEATERLRHYYHRISKLHGILHALPPARRRSLI